MYTTHDSVYYKCNIQCVSAAYSRKINHSWAIERRSYICRKFVIATEDILSCLKFLRSSKPNNSIFCVINICIFIVWRHTFLNITYSQDISHTERVFVDHHGYLRNSPRWSLSRIFLFVDKTYSRSTTSWILLVDQSMFWERPRDFSVPLTRG